MSLSVDLKYSHTDLSVLVHAQFGVIALVLFIMHHLSLTLKYLLLSEAV